MFLVKLQQVKYQTFQVQVKQLKNIIMNDKYYTPEIEEFHIWFEFEYLPQRGNWILEISGDKWIKETFTGSCGCDGESEVHEIHRAIETKKCRVKYLDREDIERSFEGDKHFVYSSQTEGGFDYFQNNQKDKLFYHPIMNRCVIELWDKERQSNYVAFLGVIKNKSELKRILKQIGI